MELGLWSLPQGVGEVESLNWSVYEVSSTALDKKIEKTIQKRKKVVIPAKAPEVVKTKYKFDKIAKYGLVFSKSNKKIEWHVDRDKGSF